MGHHVSNKTLINSAYSFIQIQHTRIEAKTFSCRDAQLHLRIMYRLFEYIGYKFRGIQKISKKIFEQI